MAQPGGPQNEPYNSEMSMASLPNGSQYYHNSPQRSVSGYMAQSQGGKSSFAEQHLSPTPYFHPQGSENRYHFAHPLPSDPTSSRSISPQSAGSYAPEADHGGAWDPNKVNTANRGNLPRLQRDHGGGWDPNTGSDSQKATAKIPRRAQKPSVPQQTQVPFVPGVLVAQAQQQYEHPLVNSPGGAFVSLNGPGNFYRPPANGGQSNSGYSQQQPYQPPAPPSAQPSYGQVAQGSTCNGYPLQSSQAEPVAWEDPSMGTLRFGLKPGIADTVAGHNKKIRRTKQKGYWNCLNYSGFLKWKFPNIYQKSGIPFKQGPQKRHRDFMQRIWEGPEGDRYLSPTDGHLAKLVVQCTQDVYKLPRNSTYRRTFVRNVSPVYLLVANWPFESVSTEVENWDEHEWTTVCLKWLPACIGLLFVLLWSPNAAVGEVRYGGWYAPFPYRFWGYPKSAINIRENPHHANVHSSKRLLERILRPRWLCFLNEGEKGNPVRLAGITVREVTDDMADVDYLMIGYTTKQFDNYNDEDMSALHLTAERAAREAGVQAFWVAGSCMRDAAQKEEDVYRINDVVRGAHSLVIVVGPSDSRPEMESTEDMLKMWGERVWTLPEVLLSSQAHPIKVYTRGQDEAPWEIWKRHFAGIVWGDPLISRQLVDHYNKTLELSRLELVSIALRCLLSREKGQYLDGDLSYALMGLLRQRPTVDKTDSLFQSFARLSMANDSDQLLERLVCMLPKEPMLPQDPWTKMDDQWDCNLWDIYPSCQVAGICNNDTVLLDGAFGAAIRWKSFAPVAYLKKDSWKRFGARILIHGAPLYFIIGCIMVVFGEYSLPLLTGLGAIFLTFGLGIILVSPFLVRLCYSGKLWGTQAWFFGFEGYMDLATIESNIFGAYMGRLKWSPAGSALSRHMSNNDNECVGLDPTTDDDVRALVDRALHAKVGEPRIFTIVDTYTLTVTMFTAVRPPVAAILCGREGGMQRAVMCSYDWSSQTLYRETVLRMETPILERMFRVNRFRFGLKRPTPAI